MNKLAHPPQPDLSSSVPSSKAELLAALDDALFELADTTKKERAKVGVLPILATGSRVPSMSLGTPRFCSDQPTPVQPADLARSLEAYDGSTPIACIEWSRVTFYREQIRDSRPPQPSLFQDQNLTRGQFNGYMSRATRGKVRKSVSTWIRSIMIYRAEVKRKYDPGRAYPVFVTLTLPVKQMHGDAEINRKILQPYLIRLRRDYEIENYFWRAEAQENGNLHYHLLVDRFIPKRYLQLSWNMAIETLGYLTKYYEESGSLTPPSTEVHRIRDRVKDRKTGQWRSVDPVDYLIDYVMDTPQPEPDEVPEGEERPAPRKLIGRYRASDGTIQTYTTRPIEGRVWGMSDTLRGIREPRAEATVSMVTALEKAKDQGLLRRVDMEHATMYFGPVGLVLSRSAPSAWKLVQEYYLQVFRHLYPAQLPEEYARSHVAMDPINLWLDFDNAALYHRLKLEQGSPVFETAADLDKWVAEQANKARSKKAAA